MMTLFVYNKITADDGEQAVSVAHAQAPALIVMDLAMPNMDGYAATRALRADANTARIPVIALTALAMRSDEEKAYAAGIDAYLTKPVERALLEALVARTLAARRA